MKPLFYLTLILVLASSGPAAEPESPAAAAISAAHLAAYFDTKPKAFLLDPQRLLPAETVTDREELLRRHAEDSKIDAFIYVFGADQEVPPAHSGGEVGLRHFATGKPAVIAYYHFANPQRCALFASPELAAVLPPEELNRVRLGAVAQAFTMNDPEAQFEAFASHLTSRIPTLERRLHAPASGPDPSRRKADAKAKHRSQKDLLAENLLRLEPLARPYYPAAAATLSALALLAAILVWRRHRRTFHLPDLAVEPRLGATYAAGIGGVISFSNPNLPPAAQRRQVPAGPRGR